METNGSTCDKDSIGKPCNSPCCDMPEETLNVDCSSTVSPQAIPDGRGKLRSWLNKQMRIEMSDGRILLGIFLCTDRDGNVILGSSTEYINPEAWGFSDEPRMLGLVMVPGKHIVRVRHDADVSPLHDHVPTHPADQHHGDISLPLRQQPAEYHHTSANVSPTNPIEVSTNPLWERSSDSSPRQSSADSHQLTFSDPTPNLYS